ncbi:MAG: diacylglycerol kinase [Pseudomonadota bacterium]
MERLVLAFRNSVAALRHLVRNEAAFKQECIMFSISVPLAWWITDALPHFLLLIFMVLLVLIVEVMNSAIEAACDAITAEHNANIKIAKDCGSLAVLMSLLAAGLVWFLSFMSWAIG